MTTSRSGTASDRRGPPKPSRVTSNLTSTSGQTRFNPGLAGNGTPVYGGIKASGIIGAAIKLKRAAQMLAHAAQQFVDITSVTRAPFDLQRILTTGSGSLAGSAVNQQGDKLRRWQVSAAARRIPSRSRSTSSIIRWEMAVIQKAIPRSQLSPG